MQEHLKTMLGTHSSTTNSEDFFPWIVVGKKKFKAPHIYNKERNLKGFVDDEQSRENSKYDHKSRDKYISYAEVLKGEGMQVRPPLRTYVKNTNVKTFILKSITSSQYSSITSLSKPLLKKSGASSKTKERLRM